MKQLFTCHNGATHPHTSLSSPLLMLSRCILVQYLSRRAAWLLCCLYQPPPQLNILNHNSNEETQLAECGCRIQHFQCISVHQSTCYIQLLQHNTRGINDTVCHCTVMYPTLPIHAFLITCYHSIYMPKSRYTFRKTALTVSCLSVQTEAT